MDGHLHQYLHKKTVMECEGMLLSPCSLESQNSLEKIQLRMICDSFNGKLCTTIFFSNSSTNVTAETDIITFYNELSSFDWHIPKHNVLIIGWDMNAQIGNDGNNRFCGHISVNRNENISQMLHSRTGLYP